MPSAEVRRFLHCNYNCSDVDLLETFYREVLGLHTVMRTENADDEGTAFGMYGDSESKTAFMYDHRGGRYSCSLELVQWIEPPTYGSVYPDPWFVGIQSVGYVAPDLDVIAQRAVEFGGAVIRRADDWILLRDPEGVALEVVAGEGPTEARYLRIVCTDLAQTVAWWHELGFESGDLSVAPGSTFWPSEGERRIVEEHGLVATDDSTFGVLLTRWSGPRPAGPPYGLPYHRGLFRMAMSVDDIQGTFATLSERGIARQAPHTFELKGTKLADGLTILFLRDPDGIIVELVDRPRLPARTR